MWADLFAERAAELARTAIDSVRTEFPYHLRHMMRGPGDHPTHPREVHPSFHGSFDWHSCVEMQWCLLRLHLSPHEVPRADIRELLDERLAPEAVAREAEHCAANPGHSRPYGLSWVLWFAHEAQVAADPDARRWGAALAPLAEVVAANLASWLPSLTYPVRYGAHANTAFALSRVLPYARARHPGLLAAVVDAGRRMFAGDVDYPGHYEPGGFDFLSPALTEAELMSSLLPADEFPGWLDRFLPDLAEGRPAPLFTPAHVSDPTDGLIAHLHGLNFSRAWCLRRIAAALPGDDRRGGPLPAAAARHAEASLPHVSGEDFMVEHWLAAYAVLLLDEDRP